MKEAAFGKILHLDLASFDKNTIGAYLSFLEGDINVISSFYISSINSFLTCIEKIIVSGIFIFSISIKLSFIGLLSLPIMLFINVKFGKRIKRLQEKNRKLFDLYTSIVQEAFSGISEIKGLLLEKKTEAKNVENLKQIFSINMKSATISSFGALAQVTTGFLMQITVFFVGCLMILKKNISVGKFTAFNSYLDEFLSALKEITSIHLSIQNALVSMNRFDEMINNGNFEYFNDQGNDFLDCGDIEFKGVNFGYNERKIIKDFNLNIKENELVVFVGGNGSGKTTLLNLLVRFYNYHEGEILIGGKRIEDIELYQLRKNITYIQQQPFLFNDTLRNNLLMGMEDYYKMSGRSLHVQNI